MVASLLAAAEIAIWLVVTSTVLLGTREDPLRAVAFGLAFVFGIYFGIMVEDKLAIGLSQVEVIAEFEEAKCITRKLREHGYGATTFDCEGLDGKKLSISLKVRRKDVPATIDLLREYESLFVTITDIRGISIGNIRRLIPL